MKLHGGINLIENGLTNSLRAMHVQSELLAISNENVHGFDKVGYQRKDPVVSSFTEFLGIHGLSTAIDDQVGRITATESPLDFAIAKKGYFQYLSPDGVRLTRDGRFKLDKEGNLLTLENSKVLANDGTPIKLHIVPQKDSDVKVEPNGALYVFNPNTCKMEYVATMSVVSSKGIAVLNPDIKQGFSEYSNVSLATEFMEIVPIKRNFEANRQMFILQNNLLSSALQELGKA